MKSKTLFVILLSCLAGLFWQGFSAGQKSTVKTAKQLAKSAIPGLHLREVTAERVVLEWVAPAYEPIVDSETGAVTEIVMEGAPPVHEPGVILLPGVTELLDALPGHASVSLLDAVYETINLGPCLPMPEDFVVDARPSSSSKDTVWAVEDDARRLTLQERRQLQPKKASLWPSRMVELSEPGIYRGHRLLALNLRPIQINTLTGQGRVLKRATIQVIRPNSSNNEIRQPDRASETQSLRALLGNMAETSLPSRAAEHREERFFENLDEHEGPIYNVNSWRIYVRETSMIRLTGAYMHLMGVPLDQITPWDLHIYNKGREIPIVVEGQEDGRFDEYDYIDFFGERNEKTFIHKEPSLYEDPYSVENCYQLYWGDGRPGLRMGEEDGSWQPTWGARTVRSVRVKLHFEKDRFHDRLGQATGYLATRLPVEGPLGVVMDNWFWGERVDALTSRDFEGFIPYPNRIPEFSFKPVIVRASLTGLSATPGFNHYAIVSLNALTDSGLTVGRQNSSDPAQAWGGQSPVVFSTKLDSSSNSNIRTEDLIHGNNIFTVTVPGNAIGGTADKIYVNWFEVEYERDLRAFSGQFRFDFDQPLRDTVAYDIRGFADRDVQVWKLGSSRLTSLDVRRVTPSDESASWAVRFPMISSGKHDVLVWSQNSIFPPFSMTPDTFAMDLRNHPGAEYIIIAYDPYMADTSVQMLDSVRRVTFNNSVLTVPLSEVYEQFSGGLATPFAIRDFLRYAYNNWSVRPTHCCLVGDAVLEQREGSIPGNQLPTFAPFTPEFGACATDYLMGCVSGPENDIIPDIAVGRISCRTPFELQTYVGKVLKYESIRDYEGLFQSNVLMIADTHDNQFNFVTNYSEPALRELVGSACTNITRLYLDSIPAGQGPIRLRDALRDGSVIVNYNGHGGGGVWSGSRLIDVAGVRLLNNRDTYPFVTNFTCYVGAFDSRSQAAVLGEAFLFTRNNNNDLIGASGFYSSAGVGWAIAGLSMQLRLYDFVMTRPAKTMGEAAAFNKARFWSSNNQPVAFSTPFGMMMMMNLLGDPGLRLAIPNDDIFPEILGESNVLDPTDSTNSDSLRVIITLPWDPQEFERSNTTAFVLPYNGELYNYRQIGDRIVPSLATTQSPIFDPNDVEDAGRCVTRVCTTDAVALRRFVAPRGRVVVYVTDPILKRNAIGCFPIFLADSLTNVQIFDVAPIPGPVAFSNEVFRVGATILHVNDVERVRFRGIYTPPQGPVQIDTFNLAQTEPGYWQTPRELGPYEFEGGSYRMKFFVKPFGEAEFESEFYDLRLEVKPDLTLTFVRGFSPAELGGARPYYGQPIRVSRSTVSRPFTEVTFRLTGVRDSTYVLNNDTVRVVLDSFTVNHIDTTLNFGEAERSVLIPTSFKPGRYSVTIQVDPDNVYLESSETNNRRDFVLNMPSYYPSSRARGTFYERPLQIGPHRYPSTTRKDTLYVRVLPNVLSRDSAAIGYTQPRILPATEIGTLGTQGLAQPFSQSVHGVFKALFDDSVAALSSDFRATVTVSLDGRDTLRSQVPLAPYSLYVKDPRRGYWLIAEDVEISRIPTDTIRVLPEPVQPSRLDTLVAWRLRATGVVPYLGEIGIFRRLDTQGPRIELAVGGLRFTQGSLVPNHPQIFATFSDAAGVHRYDGSFHLILDGDTISEDLITWNDTMFTTSSMTAMIEPDLEAGQHTLKVIASDNHNNTSEYEAQFDVRGTFGFEWAINYPNPFQQNTTISYVLTGVTDDFTEVKIYTVSGRLIRTLRDTERATANYRTQLWDGRDETGDEVANGVYFARIVAKQGDQSIEETIKLAKVRK